GALGPEPFDDAQRSLDRRVRRMGSVAQGIEEQDVKILQFSERGLGDIAVVREISRTAKAKTIDLSLTVNHRNRLKARAEQFDGPLQQFEFYLRQPAKFVIRIEDITKCVTDEVCCLGPRVKRKLVGLMAKAKRAQIVEAKDVIGVTVRV